MAALYFETIHKATMEYPYVDLLMADLNYVAHYHEEIEVIYLLEGKLAITVNGMETVLEANDIYIVMPGEIHGFVSSCENKAYIMKFFSPQEFSYLQIQGKITVQQPYYQTFQTIIKTIASEDHEKADGYRFAVNMQANNLLLEIIRTCKPKKLSDTARKEFMKKVRLLHDVKEYLVLHYKEKIDLDRISAYLHYSKFYFSHMFKEATQTSFVEYLALFRLEKAKFQLLSGKTITETALDCGFHNLRSFHRCFKKHYGINPQTFKQRNKLK